MQQVLIATSVGDSQAEKFDEITERRLQRFRSRQKGIGRLSGISLFPPDHLQFDALFFKKIMHFADKYGYTTNGKLHITLLRRIIRRFAFLLEAYPEEQPIENVGNLHLLPTWIEWTDIRIALYNEDEPLALVIQLNWAERLGMVLEDNNSLLGKAWTIFIMGCILVSVLMIVLGDGGFPAHTADFTVIVFTVEYFLKLVAAAGIRRAVLDIDRTLEEAMPKPGEDPNVGLHVTSMTAKRIQNFFLTPMNIVDFVSILPWWFQTLMKDTGEGGFSLSFLRVVRVLRLVRLLRLGGFAQDFQIMSQVFARSAAAISAIALTLCLLSLLFAAVMGQMDPDLIPMDPDTSTWTSNQEWMDTIRPGTNGDVPRAMLWVAGRFTGMQSNLFNKGAVPSSWVNQFLVHAVGIMKGFIFLLPLGQMKQFFKDADNARKEMGLLEYEVYAEQYFEAGQDWSRDKTSPYALIEVWNDIDALTDEALLSKGTLNLPISVGESVEDTNCLIYMRMTEGICGRASDNHKLGLHCEVSWVPEASGAVPECGVLNIRFLHGMGFPAPRGQGWRLRISVPSTLFGGGLSTTTMVSEPVSAADQESPVWDQNVQFNVDWSAIADSHPKANIHKEKKLAIEEAMKKALKEQSYSMQRIEDSVNAFLEFRRREVLMKSPRSPRTTSRSPRY
jgi:hypothetical protein